MSDERPVAPEADPDEKAERKKKDKLRSAWISFVGRIVAQIVGAAATIVLGLTVAGRLPGRSHAPEPSALPSPQRPAAEARSAGAPPALVVLPLDNFSRDPQQDFFADGMTESLIASLSRIRALRVISRTSAMRYKGVKKPLPEIARELGVDLIVEGSVARDGPRVRITAQLIDARTDSHLWADSYERPMKDVLSLQAEVASAIARQIDVVLTPGELGRLAPTGTVDPEAYAAYLKGRYAWNARTREGFESAIRYFIQAIGHDPGYAAAFAGLADSYLLQGLASFDTLPSEDALKRARAAAERAIALDPELAEAHTSLAAIRHRYDWDLKAAEAGFRRASELNPGYVTAHQWYANLLAEQGRHDEALREARRAVELDPLSPLMQRTLAYAHYMARRFEEAENKARDVVELDPRSQSAYSMLARVLLARGDPQGAVAVCERIRAEDRGDELQVLWGYAQARAGHPERARELLRSLRARSRELQPHQEGLLLVGLGENDAALSAFERALLRRSDYLLGLKTLPLLDALRAEQRYHALVKKVGPGAG
jgi:TolB-like protein/Tfp pilus assembly protein PilF